MEKSKERIKNWKVHPSMRGAFSFELYKAMAENKDIVLLTGDLGFGVFDNHRDDFPDRFINCGAAEHSMMDIAIGLALEGKIPVVYSITPFLLYRPFEVLRTYINHEKIPVKLIGGGRDDDYKHDGFSHYAGDDHLFMQHFENIISVWPVSVPAMKKWLKIALEDDKPYYINLRR